MKLRSPTLADAKAILAVCVARDIADIGHPDYDIDDVRADWDTPGIEPEHDCFVVENDAAQIVGYAVIDSRSAVVVVHPQAEGQGAGTLLREAIEARAAQRGLPPRQAITASNLSAVAHLRAAGYSCAHAHYRMRIDDLDAPAPVVAVRRFDLAREGAAVHEMMEPAFAEIDGNVPVALDAWMKEAERGEVPFRLAIDDDEGLAGALTGERWQDGVGYVARVAVARRARGRGYGRALLRASFAAFREAGLTSAELSVNGSNASATRLYESVGMREAWRQERWER